MSEEPQLDSLDEVVRALAALAVGDDAPLFPCITVGHAVGAMTAWQAHKFATLCVDYVDGCLAAVIRPDGLMTLRRVAA